MQIRICSDLHVDINETFEFGFTNDKDLTIIAGDIAGDADMERAFLAKFKASKNPVVCVGGNHLGYNYLYKRNLDNVYKGTKQQAIEELKQLEYPIVYLENQYIMVNNKVIFGGTMYTDFGLYGDPDIYGLFAEKGMNDFRFVYTNELEPVTYKDYIRWFRIFKSNLEACIRNTEYANFDIIVVSHFAPSIKSISTKYNGAYRNLNPAYASDLEQFILENPRIKLWVHGHMHDDFDYKIGQCRVVCHPYGYIYETMLKPSEYKGKVIRLK